MVRRVLGFYRSFRSGVCHWLVIFLTHLCLELKCLFFWWCLVCPSYSSHIFSYFLLTFSKSFPSSWSPRSLLSCLIPSCYKASPEFSHRNIEFFNFIFIFACVIVSVSIFVEFIFQILNYLGHFIQLFICIILAITQVFIVIILEFSEVFACVFFKFLNKVYDCSSKFCVLEFLGVLTTEHFSRTARFDGRQASLVIQVVFVLVIWSGRVDFFVWLCVWCGNLAFLRLASAGDARLEWAQVNLVDELFN